MARTACRACRACRRTGCKYSAIEFSPALRHSGWALELSGSVFWRSGTATHHGSLVLWSVTLHTSLALQPSGPTLKAPWPSTLAVRGGTPALLQSSTQALQPSTLALWPSTLALRVRHSHTPAGTPASL